MFVPWRGENYENNTLLGCRLLVLGESRYTDKATDIGTSPEDFTCDVVRYFPLGGRYNKFFSTIQSTILGHDEGRDWRKYADAFWNSVAFVNYVPVLVDGRSAAEGGNERRPQQSMFAAGAETFKKNLVALEPDAVVVCGLETWGWVAPQLDGFTGAPRDVVFYDDGRSIFSRIHHPSYRGFDRQKWHIRTRALIEKTAEPHERGRRAMWRSDERWIWERPDQVV